MDLSPWYCVCTKAIFITIGSYGMERAEMYSPSQYKNRTYLCVPSNYPVSREAVNWGGPIAMVPCLHQGNIYIKRKLRVWRDQKCIHLVGTKTQLTCAGRQTTPCKGRMYRAENGNLCKLGWTYRHGAVFASRQYLYQKEATGMERVEMYSVSQCKNPTYLCGPSNYPV